MKKNYGIGLLIIFVLGIFLSKNILTKAENIQKKENLGVPVLLEEVIKGDISVEKKYIGNIKSKNQLLLSFKQPGFLKKLYVQEGANFQKGDLLAQLDIAELVIKKESARQKIINAQLSADHLKDLLEKNKILYNAGAVTKQQIEDLTLKYKIAANNLKEAAIYLKELELLLRNSKIFAPYNGVVRDILKNEEEFLQPGQPVLKVSGQDDLIAEIAVIEKDLEDIDLGTKAIIDLKNGVVIKSKVAEIANIVNPQTRTVDMEIPVFTSESTLLPNMSVKVSLIKEEKEDILMVSSKAIINRNGQNIVYCYENDKALAKKVELGLNTGKKVEIISGLKLGDKVIVSNLHEINNNSRVFVYKGVE